MSSAFETVILQSLRRITRSIDLHSRQLATTYGLTGPQLVCLRTLRDLGDTSSSMLAREVSLSQSTITGILDRLSARQLVTRTRSDVDRRQVNVRITSAGMALIQEAPSPLQERFVKRLAQLTSAEQERIADTLRQVVKMMDGEDLEAAPVLSTAASGVALEEETELE